MKKLIACVLLLIMISAPAAAYAEEWDMSVPTEVTEEIREIFDKAAAKLVGVNYTPVAVLGKNESTYCILCKASVVYPGAEPYNALVYVGESGVQNIYELWIDKHAGKEEAPEQTADEPDGDIQYVL